MASYEDDVTLGSYRWKVGRVAFEAHEANWDIELDRIHDPVATSEQGACAISKLAPRNSSYSRDYVEWCGSARARQLWNGSLRPLEIQRSKQRGKSRTKFAYTCKFKSRIGLIWTAANNRKFIKYAYIFRRGKSKKLLFHVFHVLWRIGHGRLPRSLVRIRSDILKFDSTEKEARYENV